MVIALLVACGDTPDSVAVLIGDTDTWSGTDADGDGHASVATGGDDCDDADVLTYGGATEWCDDVDQDCDGEPLAPGSCGLVQPLTTQAFQVNRVAVQYLYPVRDVTGDGLDDVLGANGDGTVGITPGTGDIAGLATWNWIQEWQPTFDCGRNEPGIDVGDIDGDGFNDVAIEAPECVGGVVIAWGPVDATEVSSVLTEWPGPDPGYAWTYLRVADVDGDGASDVIRAPQLDGVTTLEVFFGGSRLTALGYVVLDTTHEAVADRAGDIDGDGLEDIIVSPNPAYASWISAGEVARGARLTEADLTGGIFIDDAAWDTNGGQAPVWLAVGDWSGDGHDDVVLVDRGGSTSDPGHLLYLDDLNQPEVFASGIVENDVSLSGDPSFGYHEGLIWHDEKPAAIQVDSVLTTASSVVVPSTWIQGSWMLSEVEHLSIGVQYPRNLAEDVSASAAPWGRGDLDGDGWSDVFACAGPDDDEGTWIFRPFSEIPWDQPQYW